MLITDSAVGFGKRRILVIAGAAVFYFSNVKPVEAVGTQVPHQQMEPILVVSHQGANELIKSSEMKINSEIESKLTMPSWSIIRQSDLRNSQWREKFIVSLKLRGGEDKKLIRSILSKVSDEHWDIPSINKILQKIADVSFEIGSNPKLLRILAELEKPAPNFLSVPGVDGWVDRLPARRNEWVRVLPPRRTFLTEVQKPNSNISTPSIHALLDSRKSYGHREAYNMPRSVAENFKTNAVRKVYTTACKNERFVAEYQEVKDEIANGIHPLNIGAKSEPVSATKVLIKKSIGRYLVEVSDNQVVILGVGVRTNAKSMSKFSRSMNKLYDDVTLKGYD